MHLMPLTCPVDRFSWIALLVESPTRRRDANFESFTTTIACLSPFLAHVRPRVLSHAACVSDALTLVHSCQLFILRYPFPCSGTMLVISFGYSCDDAPIRTHDEFSIDLCSGRAERLCAVCRDRCKVWKPAAATECVHSVPRGHPCRSIHLAGMPYCRYCAVQVPESVYQEYGMHFANQVDVRGCPRRPFRGTYPCPGRDVRFLRMHLCSRRLRLCHFKSLLLYICCQTRLLAYSLTTSQHSLSLVTLRYLHKAPNTRGQIA